jgi:hypothetical protein
VSGLTIGLAAGVLVLGAASAGGEQAGTSRPSPAERAQQIQARFQIAAMEGVLERAVQLGAENIRVQVQAVAPELLFINRAARARGFWLDGYGVFFDVDVPAMRRSLMWTFQVLNAAGGPNVDTYLRRLRQEAQSVENPAVAARLQQTILQLEREIGPTSGRPGPGAARASARPGLRTEPGESPSPAASGSAATTPASPGIEDALAPDLTPGQAAILDDPGLAYTTEVKNALIEAMIEYSAPIPLAADQWLTVAARDQEGTRVQAGDPYEVSTLLLRIRGADLAAYRAGHIDAREVRHRVQIKEY